MTETMLRNIQENADRVFFPYLGEDNIFTKGIKLDNELFRVGDFSVYWYGFLIALGALLAIIFAFTKFKKFGINPDKATDAIIGGFIGAVVGARLYYVLFSLSDYIVGGKIQWKEIINIRDGGLAIYGGIIGALLVGGIITRINKIRVLALFDLVGMGLLIGQTMGRWGNFFNQEAYGSVTKMPWGMTSAKIISELSPVVSTQAADIVVHPCFLYESLWCILGFVLLNLYMKKRKFDGEIFFMYLAWYGLGRAMIEGLRTDSLYIGNTSLRVSQLLAISCVVIAISVIAVIRIKIKESGNYKFFYETDISIEQLEAYNNPPKKEKEKITKEDKKDISKAIDNAFEENKKIDEDEINLDVFDDNDDDDYEEDDDDGDAD